MHKRCVLCEENLIILGEGWVCDTIGCPNENIIIYRKGGKKKNEK